MDARAVRQRVPGRRVLAVVLAAAAVAVLVVTALLGQADLRGVRVDPYSPGDLVVDAGVVAGGLLLAVSRPRNAIGWLLLAFALVGAAQNLATVYAAWAFLRPELHLPLGPLAASAGGALWVPGLYLLVPLLLLLYPDGRLPSPRSRWVCVAGAAGALLVTLALATASGFDDVSPVGRPVVELPVPAGLALGVGGAVLFLGSVLAALTGTLVRTARARGAARAQLLWLLVAVSCVLVLAVTEPPGWLFSAGLALVPLAVAVGVLRYRLLGVEVVVRGTLLYGVLTALVLAVYVGTTVAVSALVPTGPLPEVVGAALVAVLLVPARNRLQRGVDRLVRGPRPDPLAEGRQRGAEDERARLRRDLHDGLGPSLSGVVLGLDAVAATVRTDPDAAERVVGRLREEAERAVDEVRRIIDALRPSALDGQALVPALRARAAGVAGRLAVDVEAPEPMPALPPDVEAAAYRIVDEAVNNVVRHSGAAHCLVRVSVGPDLVLEVRDDGCGLPDRPRDGVGLTSMRQRAEELGGSFAVRSGGDGGAVVVRLPVGHP
ncbi:histidine kinase [Geodermatophilus sp. URMC 64]